MDPSTAGPRYNRTLVLLSISLGIAIEILSGYIFWTLDDILSSLSLREIVLSFTDCSSLPPGSPTGIYEIHPFIGHNGNQRSLYSFTVFCEYSVGTASLLWDVNKEGSETGVVCPWKKIAVGPLPAPMGV